VPKQVACTSNAACTEGLDKLETGLTCNSCDGGCFAAFAATNASAKAINDCIERRSKFREHSRPRPCSKARAKANPPPHAALAGSRTY
jgi:hypothetical protein